MMRSLPYAFACCVLTLSYHPAVLADDEASVPSDAMHVEIGLESGPISNTTGTRGTIFSEVVSVPDARWIRLLFDEIQLTTPSTSEIPTTLRVTSLLDGGSQTFDAITIDQWRHTTACFNGPAVLVEVIADPGSAVSIVSSSEVIAGLHVSGQNALICGEDDRQSTNDPRVARIQSTVCTAWMINDCEHCFLTAGHCMTSAGDVVLIQFNVPPSDDDGFIQHPPPEFQFAVDPNSIQFSDLFGHDYAYFGCFPNSTTGLTPFETMGPGFDLFTGTLEMDGRELAVTGYGDDFTPSPHVNRTQQTDTNIMTSLDVTTVGYYVDTTTGNSGSVVIDTATGEAIAIHTHGGCLPDGTGENVGTLVSHPVLQIRLANPLGVCAGTPGWSFSFPEGLPEFLDPAGATIRVIVDGNGADAPVSGTGELFYDIGFGIVNLPMLEVEPNVYDAEFPAIACGTAVDFYFGAEIVSGEQIFHPQFPGTNTLSAMSALDHNASFIDSFEADLGWTVSNGRELEDGGWERGIPAGFGLRGDPPEDADGSGQCFLTANRIGNSDVDGGPTVLCSPPLDVPAVADPALSYRRWFNNQFGGPPNDDSLIVEISGDAGATWHVLEVVGEDDSEAGGGWFQASFTLSDIPSFDFTDTVHVRFTTADSGFPSLVEAGIDDVRINRTPLGFVCEPACSYDCAPAGGDSHIDIVDLLELLAGWGVASPCAVGDDDIVGADDLVGLLDSWGPCDA